MKAAFWALGEYGYLLSTKLANGTNGHDQPEDDTIRVDDEDENDAVTIPFEEVLNVVCEAVDRATVLNHTTKTYGVSAISKLIAQLGVFTPRARQSLEKHAMSRNTELRQRCKEFLFLVSDVSRLPALFPVDASCEDFENIDFSFLNEFTDILRAAGAAEYQEHMRVTNDYDFQFGASVDASSPGQASAAATSTSKLRFDAYEPPKLFETTIAPPTTAAALTASEAFSMDDLSRMVANANVGGMSSASAVQTGKPNVKAVWGPKGYMGSLPSLGGAVPAETGTISSPSSVPPSAPSIPTAAATQSLPYQSPDYDFGGGAAEEATMAELSPPPPPPPKKPEMSEKEKAAMALFGGLGGGTANKGSKSKQSTLSGRSAPSASSQPQAKKPPAAPQPDLFSLEADLLGVGTSPPTQPPAGSAMFPPAHSASSATDNLLDLFSAPSLASAPMPSFAPITPPTPPASRVLQPHPMDTGFFGSLWPSHSAEARVSVKVTDSFRTFLQALPEKVGSALVEFIPATQEAIFAGDASPVETVLIHAKDRGGGVVDLMVRSKQPSVTEKVLRACRDATF